MTLIGCTGPAPPPLPAGIAELRLPRDSRALTRLAVEEDPSGSVARRREVLSDVAGQLLMPPPNNAFVPELFDLLVALAPRMEAGAISPAWGSYVYTTYQRDLVQDRPTGAPRRSRQEVERALEKYVEFFHLQKGRKLKTIEDWSYEDTRAWRDERREGR